jgi:TetR/AcrR family transcriptional regulator, transcriptional repressor for nem operon
MAQKPKADTAARILDVAERLVQVHGFNAFSYADVATDVQIRKASLHHHFPTKAALGQALITRYRTRFSQALAEILAGASDARDRLKAYARLYTAVLRKRRMCLCGVLAADFETLPGPMRQGVVEFFDDNEAWLAGVLEEGRREKTLQFQGPATTLAAFVVSSLEGAMLVARSYGRVERFEAVVKKLLGDLERKSLRSVDPESGA